MKKKFSCTDYFIILGEKDFENSTPKIQKLMFGLTQKPQFGL